MAVACCSALAVYVFITDISQLGQQILCKNMGGWDHISRERESWAIRNNRNTESTFSF